MKYLIDLFVPYGSFFETNILSTPISSILNNLAFVEITFFIFLSSKFMFFPHNFIIILVSKQ